MDEPAIPPPVQPSRAARRTQRLQAEVDRLNALVTERSAKLAAARAEADRLRNEPVIARLMAVRSGVRRVGRGIGRARSLVPGRARGRGSADGRREAAAAVWFDRLPVADVAARLRLELGAPPPAAADAPASVLLLIPGGSVPPRAWVDAIAETTWPRIEWLVVTDVPQPAVRAVADRLARGGRGSVHVVSDASLATAREQAIERATGTWIAFLEIDCLPAEPGWLARLVAGLQASGAHAASPRIIGIADRAGPAGTPVAGSEPAEVRLLSRGEAFRPGPGLPVPESLGRAEDPFGPLAGATTVRAIPGDAGLLLARADLADLRIPPVGTGAELATEIGLRLAQRGDRVAYVGSSVLWRHPSPADRGAPDAPVNPWLELHGRWGPRLQRQVWRDALAGPGAWASRPLRAGIASRGGAADPVRQAVAAGLHSRGWLVDEPGSDSASPPDVGTPPDVLVIVDPATDLSRVSRDVVRIGWLSGPSDSWLGASSIEDLDLIVGLAGSDAPATIGGRPVTRLAGPGGLHDALATWLEAVRFAIHIGPADWAAAGRWGDTPFARAIARQLEALGHPVNLVVYAERDALLALRADVALHIVGTRLLPLRPAHLNLLWIISHPDAVRAERCERYDLVFVASDSFRDDLAEQVSVPVIALHQATDPARFLPEEGGPVHELLFVGNSRNRHRPVLDALAGTEHDLAVYGGNWRPELLDPRYLRGDWIPNEEVHRAYRSAAIVLNDHWPDMRDEGFISNRIYDVLASGGFVLTDPVAGLEPEFDGAVATWADPAGLRAAIDRYLADPALRRSLSERGRAAVLARHTFASRAASLVAVAGPLWAKRPTSISPGPGPTAAGGPA
ncbi:MAG TPA: glycosyltransferase [Candidatus Limnocylindrales bacterium]|nr:glycosyltransferase [Candidatus Limnocylindrales bacterium]